MSGIGGVGGSNAELVQMLQQMASRQGGQGPRVGGGQSGGGGGPGAMMQNQLVSFAESAGLDTETVSSLQADVKSAVTTALEDAGSSGTNPKEAVSSAVRGVFDEYGLDSEAFKGQMDQARSDMRSKLMGALGGTTGGPQSGANLLGQLFGSRGEESDVSSLLAQLNISLVDEQA
jgi:hypothetical protein